MATPTPQAMFLTPHNAASAQNRPVGTGATYSGLQDTSAKAMAIQSSIDKMRGAGAVNHVWPRGNHAIINASGNTLRTISYHSVNSAGTPNFFPISLHMPAGPWDTLSEIGDSALVILDAAGSDPYRMVELYRFNRNVMWAADTGRALSILGTGHAAPGASVPTRVGMTAAGAGYLLGTVRRHEVVARTPWRHALHCALPRLSNHPLGPILSRDMIWPASAGDHNSNDPNHNTGNIPYGCHLAIPPVSKGGPNIGSLGLSQLGVILFECMRDYGMYPTDGAQNPVLRVDADLTNADMVDLRTAFRAMWQYTRAITNSVSGATATRALIANGGNYSGQIGTPTYPSGGGDPLAPNMGWDANGDTPPDPPPSSSVNMGATFIAMIPREIIPA